VAQRREKASSKLRSRSPRESVESLRRALKRESGERKEALERERATSGILRVIAESRTDIQPVFDTIVRNAIRLCGGMSATAYRYDGEQLHLVATSSKSVELKKLLANEYPMQPHERQAAGRAILAKATIKIEDALADPAYDHRAAIAGAFRRVLAVPMLRSGEPIGVIAVVWAKPGPVSARQEQLLKTFADQAVIAIENVRLFDELKTSNSSLREALDQQTATADILRVISSSPTDIQPVMDAVAANAARVCNAMDAAVMRVQGEALQFLAHHGPIPTPLETGEPLQPLNRGWAPGRAVLDRTTVQIEDLLGEGDTEFPLTEKLQRRLGFRTVLATPLLRAGVPIGAIAIRRREAQAFSHKQIELLKTFADQAVIAIENVRLFNETKEALERQTATADILKVISRSPSDIQPVFDAVAESAARLCEATDVIIRRIEGGLLREVVHIGSIPLPAEVAAIPVSPRNVSGRAVIERRTIHIHDVTDASARDEYPEAAFLAQRGTGFRTLLVVPLVRNDVAVGLIAVRREERHPFSDEQIGLLQTFADQAVIAIENVRLFNETKEALERQTATGEVLASISGSMTDTKPVFDAIVHNTMRLFGTNYAAVLLRRDQVFELVGFKGEPGFERLQEAFPSPVDEHTISGEVVIARQVRKYTPVGGNPAVPRRTAGFARRFGFNSILAAPMMWKGEAIGAIVTSRRQPLPFDDKQVLLIQSFANQAVIAIENVRLFKELQERTEALTKSVGQLTALGEVGQAISSTLDLDTVLKTIVSRAVQLAGLDGGSIYEFDDRDERFHLRAAEHVEEEILEVSRSSPIRLGEGAVGRAGATREPVVVEDLLDKSYQSRARELLIKTGSRALLAVPLLREDLLFGALVVSRNSPGPFAPEVIDLLKTFATQSAVAIQNARLFNETNEALEQQKASADVLATISSSIADTEPVFDKILQSCGRLFAGQLVGINLLGEDGMIHSAAYHGPAREEFLKVFPVPADGESATARAIADRRVLHYPDVTNGPGVPAMTRRGCAVVGIQACLFSPMLWEGRGLGSIFVGRDKVGEFSEKEVALLKTFADQAAIAIQNAKLFREIQEKSAQLEVANKHKSDFLANMSHELRTPLNAIIGFSEALMDRMFGDLNEKQLEYQKDIHESGKHLLSLINDILDLSKIEAGRMELELSSFHLPTAISNAVTLIRERAMRHGIALGVEIDERLGEFQADERKLKQVLLNLLSNAVKFTPDGGRVDVSAKLDTDKVEISVKDTGVGISPEDQASLFEEFKQLGKDSSRKAEGTGLGLSLTKRLVELHGGQILVDSAVGHGSTFRVMLPMRGERLIE
jgi:GAF domain-containing protein